MKEIDFIPDWYKRNMKYEMIYRSQYFALAAIVAIIIVWNFTATRSITVAKAEINQLEPKYVHAQKNTQQFMDVEKQLEQLKQKADLLEQVDSKINVPAVLAEISFLVGKKIVLNEVKFVAEEFKQVNLTGDSIVKVANPFLPAGTAPLVGDVRFKVTIRGMATDAGCVANLICNLEDSPYFFQVTPSYSRNISTKADRIAKDLRITKVDTTGNYRFFEFEINCYLGNHRRYATSSAGKTNVQSQR